MKIRNKYREEVETDDMSYEELAALKLEVSDIVIGIEKQLNIVKMKAIAEKEYADPKWFARVNHALSINKRNLQLIQEIMGQRNRERKEKIQYGFYELFIGVCKELLPEETYMQLVNETRKREIER